LLKFLHTRHAFSFSHLHFAVTISRFILARRLRFMKPSTSTTSAIFCDLPIRSAKAIPPLVEMPHAPQLEVQDATNEQIRYATDLARINPNLTFSDALASVVGKKRNRKRRPKSKRGKVITNFKPTYSGANM
jgi:hypothetical protein